MVHTSKLGRELAHAGPTSIDKETGAGAHEVTSLPSPEDDFAIASFLPDL